MQAAPNKYQAFPEIAIDWATAFTKLINKFPPPPIYLWYNCSLCAPHVLSRVCNLSSVNSWFHSFSWGKNSPAIIMPCLFWWGRCMCLPAFTVGNLTLHRKKMKGWERALLFPELQSYWSLLWIFVLWPFHPTSVSIIIRPALFTLLFLWLRDTEDNVML